MADTVTLRCIPNRDRSKWRPMCHRAQFRAQSTWVQHTLYAERGLVECWFSKLNWFRRVATRYEKDGAKLLRRHRCNSTLMEATIRGLLSSGA